ncbi:MAG TPA: glycosyltransferase family 39 protein [Abditibacterium sp.]|jgi:4-amino-4-deoxy-L-arabinose transferase-like glycosyltransferase
MTNNSPSTSESLPAASDSAWNTRRAKWLSLGALLLLCWPLFFFRLGAWPFFDADEGRYGEIPRAMLASGDWVTPMLNGVKFFDKPPLLYWGIAFFYQILGLSEAAARLVPALAALAAVAGAYALGRRMFGARAGFFAGAILATSLVWPIMARVVLTDMLVSSLIFLAMAFWWLARSETTEKARFAYNFGFWSALGLGVLAKGPVTVVLAGGSIAFYLLLSGEREVLRRMGWKFGPLLMLLIAAPYFVIVQLRNPEYNHAFWYEQHLGRFLGLLAEKDHNNGPLYFFLFLPILFFPWTFFAPAALAAGWRKIWPGKNQTRSENGRAALYLCCGALFITLFFSGSSSKLVTYILPVLPLMAVALGGYFSHFLSQNGEKMNRILGVGAVLLSILLVVFGIAGFSAAPRALAKMDVPATSALVASAALIVWGAVLAFGALRFRLRGAIAATAIGMCVVLGLATGIARDFGMQATTEPLLEKLKPGLGPQTQIVTLLFTQSLAFYTGKRFVSVERPDELRAALRHVSEAEKSVWFPQTDAELRPYVEAKTPVYFVARTTGGRAAAFHARLKKLGDIEPIIANARFTFMGNRAARALTPPEIQR